jgi:hypothetical protein
MSSCAFEELVIQVATMLRDDVPRERIDRVLAALSPAYRADVLAAARDLLADDRVGPR